MLHFKRPLHNSTELRCPGSIAHLASREVLSRCQRAKGCQLAVQDDTTSSFPRINCAIRRTNSVRVAADHWQPELEPHPPKETKDDKRNA